MDVLTGSKRADAAIVGGGLTGLLLAASLAQEGLKVALVEASDGSFPLPREAAHIHAGETLARAEAIHGTDVAKQYAQCLQAQLQSLLAASQPYVQPLPLYTYALHRKELPAMEARRALYTRLHLPVYVAPDAGGCPFPVELSLLAPSQAVLDMVRWQLALQASIRRSGGRIYIRSQVVSMESARVCTAQGCLQAPIIILTTGIPLGWRAPHLLSCRTCAHCMLTGGMPLHSLQQPLTQSGVFLCPAPNGLIASFDTCRSGTRQQQTQLNRASARLPHLLPDWQPGEWRYTRHALSVDGLPFIGTLPDSRFLCATGVNGILAAMHAAEVLTRHVLGRALPEDQLYAPTRRLPAACLRPCQRQIAAIRMANWPRLHAPKCAHCGCRMHYTPPLALWECPLCGSACTLLGQPAAAPGTSSVNVSPRQRPEY